MYASMRVLGHYMSGRECVRSDVELRCELCSEIYASMRVLELTGVLSDCLEVSLQ